MKIELTFFSQANPKAALVKDDDDRLPIHWATAYNRFPIVELLVASKNFDPDVEVSVSNMNKYLIRSIST
jgi:ankyrin repeat protein